MKASDFGSPFYWGVSASAFQTEGAYLEDGKGLSLWDVFTDKKNKIRNGDNARVSADFYHRYPEDIGILQELGIPNFRISLSWSRIFPDGTGKINERGIDFYNKLIDTCLEKGITPWVTLFHWDLPQALSEKGGWTNRDVLGWFEEYSLLTSARLGDRVRNWMVLNEPMVFTGAGYFLGLHAPGKKGFRNFLPAMHHAALCQNIGLQSIRYNCNNANIGTTFSCSYLTPYSSSAADQRATVRMDALLNRLFIEPVLGMGYPTKDISFISKVEKYFKAGDELRLKADFDFIGIQNYTRECVSHSYFIPYLQAKLIPAHKRKVYHTSMNWEVYPEAMYEMLKKFSAYEGVQKIIITENGAAFHDKISSGHVHDKERTNYIKSYLEQALRAKKEGMPLEGYFVWSLTDNFEWAEGYMPRFGLVHINFETLKRTIKDSGRWYGKFISK